MWKFIARRLLLGVMIIFFGALISYTFVRCLPTSYVEQIARERSTRQGSKSYEETLAQLQEVYGTNTSILEGFVNWGGKALRGEWGDSWFYSEPVLDRYSKVIGYSLILNTITLLVQLLICIPLGILAARKQYSKTDYAITVFALACISLPSFFLATLLKFVFSIQLRWVDLYGVVGRFHQTLTTFGKVKDIAVHLILPTLTLAMIYLGGLMRFTRTNMLEVLNADYIRTARAKGVAESIVIIKHGLRNAILPVVTYLGTLIAALLTGSFIVERLYAIPGIGKYFVDSISGRDYNIIMGITIFFGVFVVVCNLLVDIVYGIIDPRVKIHE